MEVFLPLPNLWIPLRAISISELKGCMCKRTHTHTRLEMDQRSDPMGIESLSCKTIYDCELRMVVLQEVTLGIAMKNNDGSENDQNMRQTHSKKNSSQEVVPCHRKFKSYHKSHGPKTVHKPSSLYKTFPNNSPRFAWGGRQHRKYFLVRDRG